MENASKALLISGGILFALLTLSLVAVLITNINTMESAKDDAQALEQLSKFNQQYEVFNKDKLYGTQVITAVNKAFENNKKAQNEDDPWYINVIVDTGASEFKNTVYRAKKDDPYNKRELVKSNSLGESIRGKIQLISDGEIEKKEITMNQKMIDFFKSDNLNDSIEEDDDYCYYIYSALKTFKTRIFTGEVNYDNESGRIDEIIFTIQ